jgi:leucyl/phenylalanyl-tRNA--protein transferase
MYYLSQALFFPSCWKPIKWWILCHLVWFIERLQLAYKSGLSVVWRWTYYGGHPKPEWFCFWWIDVSKSMRNILNRNVFKVTFNQNLWTYFNCQNIERDGQNGTWLRMTWLKLIVNSDKLGIANQLRFGRWDLWLRFIWNLGSRLLWWKYVSKVSNASKFLL